MPRDWLIVGADGVIGSALAKRLPNAAQTSRRNLKGYALSLDLARDPATWQLPDAVSVAFLCAARCSIQDCRANPVETRLVNVTRTVQLVERLAARGAFVVFLSTNQVFDGSIPFRRASDATCPLTEYGRQKAEAERAVLALGGAVVRFTKVIAGASPLFQLWIDSLRAGQPVEAFVDMMFAPVPMNAAVDALVAVATKRVRGIVQVSGECDISYADAAKLLGDPGLVRPIGITSRGISPDAAPKHTTLAPSALGILVPPVRQTIAQLADSA